MSESQQNSNAFNPIVKSFDMSNEMKAKVFDITEGALKNTNKQVEIAAIIKKEMDKLYGTTWHCIVGKNFGSYVSHETGSFIYFFSGNLAFLIFKTS